MVFYYFVIFVDCSNHTRHNNKKRVSWLWLLISSLCYHERVVLCLSITGGKVSAENSFYLMLSQHLVCFIASENCNNWEQKAAERLRQFEHVSYPFMSLLHVWCRAWGHGAIWKHNICSTSTKVDVLHPIWPYQLLTFSVSLFTLFSPLLRDFLFSQAI